jgi:hypothetical protein
MATTPSNMNAPPYPHPLELHTRKSSKVRAVLKAKDASNTVLTISESHNVAVASLTNRVGNVSVYVIQMEAQQSSVPWGDLWNLHELKVLIYVYVVPERC